MYTTGTPEQVATLFAALILAQADFPPIPKTKTVKSGSYSYNYAPLPEIHEKIRPILKTHGLAVFHPIQRVDGKSCIGTTVIHRLGGSITCDGLGIPDGIKMQEQGGHVTYGSRYGYCSMLGITSQDDDDLAAKSSRQRKSGNGGVAQDGRAPLTSSSGDSGSIPDPSLPTKTERATYVGKLNAYREHVTDSELQAYLLKRSGAAEVRLIKTTQWEQILKELDGALSLGTQVLKAQVN